MPISIRRSRERRRPGGVEMATSRPKKGTHARARRKTKKLEACKMRVSVAGPRANQLQQFNGRIDSLGKPSETLALPELIEEVLDKSRLKDHYAAEKDGQD